MKEKVELPMNKKPYIHSNISRASLFSVLTSEAYAGWLNVRITGLSLIADGKEYNEFSEGSFCSCMENMQLERREQNHAMCFLSHPYTEKKYAYLYRRMNGKKNFCLEAAVDYLQDSNADSHVKLVLSKGRTEIKKKDQTCIFQEECSLKLFSNRNLILHVKEQDRFLGKIDTDKPVILRLEKDFLFTVKYSQDGIHWEKACQMMVDFDEEIEAGFYIATKLNPFYYDFFTSHIQLCYTWDNKIIAPHFDYYERYFSKMIPAMQIPMRMLDIANENIIEYFIDLISRKYYINLGVDEFYIQGRDDYKKRHFMHVNFLYGFDRERRVFQLIGFDRFMKFSEIDFDDFFHAIQRETDNSTKINVYRYCSSNYPDTLHVDAILYILKAYLSGSNCFAVSASEVILEDDRKPIVYGLDIHELICRKEDHMSRFLRDIRVIYQLYEHNLIMREMLTFFYYIQIISKERFAYHSEMFDGAIQLSSRLKNVVLKNRRAPKEHIEDKIKNMLMDLKSKEREAIQELIVTLEEYAKGEGEDVGL